MEETDPLKNKKVDHLILLVGGNPLPNAVAAQLLATENATIWLLHSDGADGEPSTKPIAQNLETFLRQKNSEWTIKLEPIPSANKSGIEQRIYGIFGRKGQNLKGQTGLHYTGGTKSMAIHVYRTLEQIATPRPVFSYLDPRKLALRIDGYGTEPDQIVPVIKNDILRCRLKMCPDKLAKLHGYESVTNNEPWANPENTPGLLELCQKIAQVNSTDKGFKAWHEWVYRQQLKEIPTSSKNPGLEPVINAFNILCDTQQVTPEMVATKLLPGRKDARLTNCQDWFRSKWLEEYVLSCIERSKIDFADKGLKYKTTHDHFELDVVVLIGYQLFVISCITTGEKDKVKEHLLEAYVRARQLGGDEARVAIVCCYTEPSRLQSEVVRAWDAQGKVEIFGIKHLGNLTQHLSSWFQKVNL